MAQGLIGVGGVKRNISEIKVGVNGVRNATEMYVGVNGAPRLCWSGNKWANKVFVASLKNIRMLDPLTLASTLLGTLGLSSNIGALGGGYKYLTYTTEISGVFKKFRLDPGTLATTYQYSGVMEDQLNAKTKATYAKGRYLYWTRSEAAGKKYYYTSPEDASIQIDYTLISAYSNSSGVESAATNSTDTYSLGQYTMGNTDKKLLKTLTFASGGGAAVTSYITTTPVYSTSFDVSDTNIYCYVSRPSAYLIKYDLVTGAKIISATGSGYIGIPN